MCENNLKKKEFVPFLNKNAVTIPSKFSKLIFFSTFKKIKNTKNQRLMEQIFEFSFYRET